MSIKFTSDLHFGHNNIIEYCNRLTTIEHHNEYLIDILNSFISPDDVVYHLGDLFYGKNLKHHQQIDILNKLNGHWKFIQGNHDNPNKLEQLCKQTGYEFLGIYHTEVIQDQLFIMFHYPIESWWNKNKQSIHLYGHVHNHDQNLKEIPNRYNVCFDKEFKIYDLEDFLIKE